MFEKVIKKIIIGGHGMGASRECMKIVKEVKESVVYLSAVPNAKEYYNKYPDLDFDNTFVCKDNDREFNVENETKYFLTAIRDQFNRYLFPLAENAAFTFNSKNSVAIARAGQVLLIYDDGAWKYQEDKFLNFWKLTHSSNDCIITIVDEKELFDCELSPEMKRDIAKYWDIQYLEENQ
ncbi:MAG: hypothetical protein K6G88_11115 [Lachnospiraceae bacterium]|nr:hypothetical protein [Lachnospiraceae bacterium]